MPNDTITDINALIARLQSYYADADVSLIRKAYDYSAKAHEGQTRKSGEPYLHHPLAVAGILTALKGDEHAIVAGLLDYLKDNVTERFLDLLAPLVATGGRMLLTNLHRPNPWRAFMEYVGDWRVLHRGREDFERLCRGGPERRMATLELSTDASDTNVFWAGRKD